MSTGNDGRPPASDSSIQDAIDRLIIGRAASFPIYDPRGLLLLAAGSEVTQEIKRNLKEREAQRLYIRALCDARPQCDDAAEPAALVEAAVLAEPAASVEAAALAQPAALAKAIASGRVAAANADEIVVARKGVFETTATRKLDAANDSASVTIANKGPAVRDRVVSGRRSTYDAQRHGRLVQRHRRNSEMMGAMLRNAQRGARQDGSGLAEMTADYLNELISDTDSALASSVTGSDGGDVATRSVEVAMLAMSIGIELGFDEENIRDLGVCTLVNDWGMTRVPAEIREATRRLNALEMLEIKRHPIYSLEMIEGVSSLPRSVALVAYQIHECPNGQGYPRGRQGYSIHPFARIIHVAEVYTALSQPRPYRPPLARYAAMERLVRLARDRYLDPQMVRALLRIQSLFPIGSYVALSDGSMARVMRRNGDEYAQPLLQRVADDAGLPGESGAPVENHESETLFTAADQGLTIERALPSPGSNEVMLDANLL